ncbi:GntR family transcriptional regulator [Pseudolysinimonas sp.]|uniref:GntR family transcriptional regulator n=1 Tax=Pseudolysinimonas sp. TaxID=2680009 RepID=UPI003F81F788
MTERPLIDPGSSVPPFEQLKRWVVDAATSGRLPHGAKLPTVRALADELALAANTVAKAYRELEAEGVIETRGRAGSFVAWSADGAESELERLAAAYVARAEALGVPRDRARAILLSRVE